MTKPSAVVRKRDALTDKQRLFIEMYFICGLNATDAAMQVYDCKDRHVARAVGAENLAKPAIRARVDERLAQFQATADEVLARTTFFARGSIASFIDPDSGVIDLSKAKEAADLGLIKRYRTKQIINAKDDTETVETEIELYDAQASLRDLGKHFGLWNDGAVNINFNQLSDADLEALAAGKKVISVEAGK